MGENKKADLISRYEKMLRGEAGCYFDAEEFDEIALEYENAGSVEDALQAVENGLKFHPGSDLLLAKKACYLLSMGHIEEAREAVSGVHIDNEESHSVKVELLLNDYNIDEGYAQIKSWLSMPDISADRCLDILDICIDFGIVEVPLQMILDSASSLPAIQQKELFEEIIETLNESGYEKHRYAVYEKILDIEPFSEKYWKEASEAYVDAGNFRKAVEAADFAIAISPNNPELILNKAYCLYGYGNYEKAVELISKNIFSIEDKSHPYEVLAECYSEMGNYAASNGVLDIAQEIYPENYRYYYIRAKNHYISGNPNYDECIENLKKALQLSPDDIGVSLLLAEVYYDMERYSDARALLGRLIDLNMAEARVYTLLGDVELKAGFPDIAIGYYRKVLGFERYNVDIYFKLIYAYSEVEDVDNMKKVIDHLETLIDGAPDNEEVEEDVLQGVRNIRKAIERIKTILRSSIDDAI